MALCGKMSVTLLDEAPFEHSEVVSDNIFQTRLISLIAYQYHINDATEEIWILLPYTVGKTFIC